MYKDTSLDTSQVNTVCHKSTTMSLFSIARRTSKSEEHKKASAQPQSAGGARQPPSLNSRKHTLKRVDSGTPTPTRSASIKSSVMKRAGSVKLPSLQIPKFVHHNKRNSTSHAPLQRGNGSNTVTAWKYEDMNRNTEPPEIGLP